MTSNKRNQKQLWVDQEFIKWLKTLRAKKQLDGEEVTNLGELTRQIVNTPAITDVEKQLLKNQKITDIKIKLDARRLF